MTMKFVIAAVAASFLVASCGDDSGSGGGGSGGGSSGMQAFVKNCQTQMAKKMGPQAKKLEKLGSGLGDKVLGAARGMCSCIGKEVDASTKITAADKAKIFAVREFGKSSKPAISDASTAAFKDVGKKCTAKMMGAMMEVMKKAQEMKKDK